MKWLDPIERRAVFCLFGAAVGLILSGLLVSLVVFLAQGSEAANLWQVTVSLALVSLIVLTIALVRLSGCIQIHRRLLAEFGDRYRELVNERQAILGLVNSAIASELWLREAEATLRNMRPTGSENAEASPPNAASE